VVYEWLTGTWPFQGTALEIALQQQITPPPALRTQLPELAPEVEQVVLTALAKDPKQRFGSVLAFATALEQASQVKQPEPEPVVSIPETEANQSQQPTEMATPVAGILLSQQTVSEGSADLPAQPQTLIPSSGKGSPPQAEAERRQEQEQTDKLEEERVPKAMEAAQQAEEEQAHTAREERVKTFEEQTSPQLRQTVPPTTFPHEATPQLPPVSLSSDGLPQAAIPAQSPATLLPPPTLGRPKRRRSPAVIAVLILLTAILLGGASFGVYGAATGNWPWIVWHAHTYGTSQDLVNVVWSGSQFVAVGGSYPGGGTILTSPDGRTWSAQNSGTSEELLSVTWSGSQFVVVGQNGTIVTSP
jgi:hypothetical protein